MSALRNAELGKDAYTHPAGPHFTHTSRASPQTRTHTVAFPYWDFMLDAELGKNWSQSEIYDNSWFGPVATTAADNFRLRGRFRDVQKVVDTGHRLYPDAGHRLEAGQQLNILHSNTSQQLIQ